MKNNTTMMKHLPAAAAMTLLPAAAFAHPGHPGHGGFHGFGGGFMHPLLGVDHLLAILAVGLLSARAGGRTLRLVPAAFVVAMALGAAAGAARVAVPFVEQWIALSVLFLGLALAAAWKPALRVAAPAAAFFALFHGLAHGAEIPAGSGALLYGTGFMAATIALLGSGIAARMAVDRLPASLSPSRLPRVAGAAMSVAGVALLLA